MVHIHHRPPIAADWERRLLRTIDPHRGVSQTR
jgi:hypothetical protein